MKAATTHWDQVGRFCGERGMRNRFGSMGDNLSARQETQSNVYTSESNGGLG